MELLYEYPLWTSFWIFMISAGIAHIGKGGKGNE